MTLFFYDFLVQLFVRARAVVVVALVITSLVLLSAHMEIARSFR